SPAFAACGLVSFICPRIAPTIRASEYPPFFSQMFSHPQPFSRLMSSSFSVRSDRFMCRLPLHSSGPGSSRASAFPLRPHEGADGRDRLRRDTGSACSFSSNGQDIRTLFSCTKHARRNGGLKRLRE